MGKKYLDIKDNSLESSVYNILHGIQEKKIEETNKNDKSDDGEGMDAVQPKAVKKKFKDRKDKDIDNDGDVDDSDKFLHKRRKAISKAIKKEGLEDSSNAANSQHLCAKNVVHENWGNGTPISGQHAEPDAEGDIAWYDVMFEHGIEKGVSINELKVTKAESHHHSEKKKKKMDEGTYRIGNMKKSGNFKAKNAEDAIKQAMKKGIKVDREFTVYDRDKREFIYKNDKPAVATKGTYKEEVDLDEGKMNQMHQMMKDGKTAAQIAKAMKLDLKTIKALMDSYNKMVPESFEIGTEKYLKHTVETTPGQKEWTETVTKKASSMRETLAKVWEADVGKSPFQKNAKEDLTKGVKGGTTMTGKKVAAVDTKPTIKEKKK